jgi:predicted amidophosphoribosyltransferase
MTRGLAARLGAAALDLVLPETCVGCGRPGSTVCGGCVQPLLGTPMPAWPTPSPAGLPPPFAVTDYHGTPRAAILAYKEQRRLALARPLGRALATSVATAWAAGGTPGSANCAPEQMVGGVRRGFPSGPTLLLVPIPCSPAAVRVRGHDPANGLARATARVLREAGVPAVRLPVLRQARLVRDQAGLSAESRAGNLAGALVVPKRRERLVAGRQVVLIDDIITTGATLAEAARALRVVAATPVAAAVIAATRRQMPP